MKLRFTSFSFTTWMISALLMLAGCDKETDSIQLLDATPSNAEPGPELAQTRTPTPRPDELMVLPLRVHILTDLVMEKRGVKMDMWVNPQHISQYLLPEINRIWKQANISWELEKIISTPLQRTIDTHSSVNVILNAKRDANGRSDPSRIPHIYSFFPKRNFRPDMFNLYLFPYIGQTSQGNASGTGNNRAVVGVWTDKPSGGTRPPIRFPVFEQRPFKIGSIGRTCAHELGHNLGLRHPSKTTQRVFNRLMGGRKQGYDLIPSEITNSRNAASPRRVK
ncbi:MAG: hypothetical protein H8E27_08245 [Verrucomicrobia subdivision 3 bacterium]|nr:hypothetical protein [Limisphaerales bacterium]